MNQLAVRDSSRLKAELDLHLLNTPVDRLRLFDAVSHATVGY